MPEQLAAATASLNRAQDPFLADKALSWVRVRTQEFEQFRPDLERRWARNWNAYWNRAPRSYYNGRAQTTPPDIRVRVDRLVPRLEAMTIGRSDFFEPRSRKPAEAYKARANKDLMTHQLEYDGFRANFGQSYLRDVVIYGTGPAKLGWKYEVEYCATVAAQNGSLDPAEPGYTAPYSIEDKPSIRNSPHGEPRDIFDIYCDPRVDWPEETDIREKCRISADDLRRMAEAGIADPAVVARILSEPVTGTTVEGRGYKDARDAASGIPVMPIKPRAQYHMDYEEFWGWFPIDLKPGQDESTAKSVQCVIGIVAEKHVVRISKNPFRGQWKPYEFGKVIKVRGQIYGVTPVDAAIELWVEKRDTRNMILDTRAYNIHPMFTADPGHRGTAYVAGLGKVLRGANLRQVQVQDNTASGLRQEEVINADLDDLFGTPPLLSGNELGGEGGATGAAIQDQNANINIKGMAVTLEETLFKRLLGKWHDLNQQFLSDVTPLSVLGEGGLEWRYIYPEDVKGSFEFVMTGATQLQSRAVLGAQFFNATTRMFEAASLGAASFDWTRWFRTYFKDVLGFEHPELYVSPQERSGPVPTTGQVIEMLLLGQKVVPDPRSNLLKLHREMTFFVDGYADRIRNPMVRENVLSFYRDLDMAVQALIIERAAAQDEMRMVLMGAKPPASAEDRAPKGKAPPATGSGQRDGKGETPGRRLMAAMAGGPQGGSRVP